MTNQTQNVQGSESNPASPTDQPTGGIIRITREIAKKVLATIDAGLTDGVGTPVPGQMCVEAAVCFALGNIKIGDAMTMTNQNVHGSESTPASLKDQQAGGTIKLTREVARKVLATIDAGLTYGVGIPVPGQMCVEAAVCFALGLPHGDDPGCVVEVLRALKIRLNESAWSSRQARARGLRRLGLAQLGSKGVIDGCEFVQRVIRLVITKQVPAALRVAASVQQDPKHQVSLNAAAEACESRADWESCNEARNTAHAAFKRRDDAAHGAAGAARAAAAALESRTEDSAAGWAVSVAEYAASAAAAYAAGTSRPEADACDKVLAEFAEDVVKILVEMKAPGCEWLDLTNAA